MLTLYGANKAYSSWSWRGWLAVKQSGLPFDDVVIPLRSPAFEAAKASGKLPGGKVPVLWDGDICVWESLAIVDWLADRVGHDRFWPADDAARAHARSAAAEMHSGFTALRGRCNANLRKVYPGFALNDGAKADTARIDALWCEARARFGRGGDFLYGAFGAADIMFAPVVTRFKTYDVTLSRVAQAYADAVLAHPWMIELYAAGNAETEIIADYEY
jgi:glutathione S-transferase